MDLANSRFRDNFIGATRYAANLSKNLLRPFGGTRAWLLVRGKATIVAWIAGAPVGVRVKFP